MIALDAMGGDNAPQAIVKGAIRAAKKGIPIVLIGDQRRIQDILQENEPGWRSLSFLFEDCTQEISMAEEPSRAVVNKKDSSMVRAITAVAQGRAEAVVSAGNSGAMLVASTLIIGRHESILRPAIGSYLPTKTGSIFCMDLGATTDCKPEYLVQFAQMGAAFVRSTKKINDPKIALLSNGHEPYKGSLAVKKAYELLEQSSLNFVGNIEARDIFDAAIDVLVCDGFAGNILIKSMQGTANLIADWLKQEANDSWIKKLYFALGSSIFKKIKAKSDYSKIGGAMLLGVKKPVVLAHGCSNEFAIEQAIIFAHTVVQQKTIEQFNDSLLENFSKKMEPHSNEAHTN